MGVRRLLPIVTATVIALAGSGLALASSTSDLYLVGDSEPVGSMSTSAPPAISLPNFDSGRDPDPGLSLAKTDGGSTETDPTKYQQWEHDASGQTLSATQLVIWAAAKDFDVGKTVRFGAYLMDCGATCSVLDSAVKTLSNTDDWRRVSLPFSFTDHSFGADRRLVVKITVLDNSDDDMWFAYATATYDAHLRVTFPGSPTTTTTTTVPEPTTTTTVPEPTTTTTKPKPTTTTTKPKPTTTTSIPRSDDPIVDIAPGITTTTTTLPTTDALGPPVTSTTTTTEPPIRASTPTTTVTIAAGDDSDHSQLIPVALPMAMGSDTSGVSTEVNRAGFDIDPQEGLMVVFSTVTENIHLYWQVAVALGLVASILLWAGIRRRERVGEKPRFED